MRDDPLMEVSRLDQIENRRAPFRDFLLGDGENQVSQWEVWKHDHSDKNQVEHIHWWDNV